MRVLQRSDYESLAKEAVDQLVTQDVPLADSLVKISNSMGLNPDQIKALVQVANTLAHLDIFDRKSDDKVVDFQTADPRDVVKRVVSDGEDSSCSSSCSGADKVTDFFGDLPKPEVSSIEEMPASGVNGAKAVSEVLDDIAPHRQQVMIIKIRKVAEELNQRKMAAALQYEETLDKLASDFASLYGPNFEDFEKDAVDVRGGDAIPVLSDLRNLLRMPTIKVAVYEKTARLVDTDTKEMKSFDKLCSLIEEHKACEAGIKLLEKEAGDWL